MDLTPAFPTASHPSFESEIREAVRARRVAIVGGGFAGAALAYHLLQRSSRLRISLIEPGPRLGRGVAYGTGSPLLRLNVPASRMSIDPSQPLDFVTFAGAEANPNAFLPRSLYGAYVSQCLLRASKLNPGQLQIVRTAAIGVCRGPAADGGRAPARAVQLADGRTLYADHVVLATGLHAKPRAAVLPRDRRVLDAWDERSIARLPRAGRVLVLGSGLTALDVLRLLEAARHEGEVVVMSRHGLLPRPHAVRLGSFEIPAHMLPVPVGLRALIRWGRRLVAEAEQAGASWQSALDSLRPHTQRIWRQMSVEDQRRFVRLVRPYWEVLRHRSPSDVLETVRLAEARGQLRVEAGRFVDCRGDADGLRVTLQSRSRALRTQTFAAVVRCTGGSLDVSEASPLLAALIRDGEARACASGLGIATGELGRVVDAAGAARSDLFALGVLCRASRWETTSVPDIVRDAVALAELLTGAAGR